MGFSFLYFLAQAEFLGLDFLRRQRAKKRRKKDNDKDKDRTRK